MTASKTSLKKIVLAPSLWRSFHKEVKQNTGINYNNSLPRWIRYNCMFSSEALCNDESIYAAHHMSNALNSSERLTQFPSSSLNFAFSKRRNRQLLHCLQNLRCFWPPEKPQCKLSFSQQKIIKRFGIWFKHKIQGKNYSAEKHGQVDAVSLMEREFEKNPALSLQKMCSLQRKTGLSRSCIQYWFKWKQIAAGAVSTAIKKLTEVFDKVQYASDNLIEVLSQHTGMTCAEVGSWFRVARALANVMDESMGDKEEIILWRMFRRCVDSSRVRDEDIELMSDLLEADGYAIFRIFQCWSARFGLANETTLRYADGEDLWSIFAVYSEDENYSTHSSESETDETCETNDLQDYRKIEENTDPIADVASSKTYREASTTCEDRMSPSFQPRKVVGDRENPAAGSGQRAHRECEHEDRAGSAAVQGHWHDRSYLPLRDNLSSRTSSHEHTKSSDREPLGEVKKVRQLIHHQSQRPNRFEQLSSVQNADSPSKPPTRLATTSSAPKETLSVSAKAAGVDAPAPFDCHRPENAKGKLDHKQIRRELRKLRRKQRKSGIPRKAQITKPQRPTPTEQTSDSKPWLDHRLELVDSDVEQPPLWPATSTSCLASEDSLLAKDHLAPLFAANVQNDQLVVLGGDEAARGREGDLATEAEEALFDLLQDSQQKVDRKLPVLATSVVQQSAGSTADDAEDWPTTPLMIDEEYSGS